MHSWRDTDVWKKRKTTSVPHWGNSVVSKEINRRVQMNGAVALPGTNCWMPRESETSRLVRSESDTFHDTQRRRHCRHRVRARHHCTPSNKTVSVWPTCGTVECETAENTLPILRITEFCRFVLRTTRLVFLPSPDLSQMKHVSPLTPRWGLLRRNAGFLVACYLLLPLEQETPLPYT